jgi:hypothetical protein
MGQGAAGQGAQGAGPSCRAARAAHLVEALGHVLRQQLVHQLVRPGLLLVQPVAGRLQLLVCVLQGWVAAGAVAGR